MFAPNVVQQYFFSVKSRQAPKVLKILPPKRFPNVEVVRTQQFCIYKKQLTQ